MSPDSPKTTHQTVYRQSGLIVQSLFREIPQRIFQRRSRLPASCSVSSTDFSVAVSAGLEITIRPSLLSSMSSGRNSKTFAASLFEDMMCLSFGGGGYFLHRAKKRIRNLWRGNGVTY